MRVFSSFFPFTESRNRRHGVRRWCACRPSRRPTPRAARGTLMAYKTINDSFYFDPEVKCLPKAASDLLLYLIINPHSHFSGIYYLPLANVPVESKLSADDVNKALDILSRVKKSTIEQNQEDTYRVSDNQNNSKQQKQKPDRVSVFNTDCKQHFFICFDYERDIIFIKSMLRHQTGGKMSERQIRSVLNHLMQLSKSSVIAPFLEYHRDYLNHCFLALEKTSPGNDEKRNISNITRRMQLQKDIVEFYKQHGLSFFCAQKYPIQVLRQESASASESASESADIVSEKKTSDISQIEYSDNEKTPLKNKRIKHLINYEEAIGNLRLGFNGLISTVDLYIAMVAGKNSTKTLSQSREHSILLELSEIRQSKRNDVAFKSALLKVINKEIDNTNYLRKTLEDIKETTGGGINGSVWDSPLTN